MILRAPRRPALQKTFGTNARTDTCFLSYARRPPETSPRQTAPDLSEPAIIRSSPEPNLSQPEANLSQTEPNLSQTEPNLRQTEPNLRQTEPNLRQTEPVLSQTEPLFHRPGPLLPARHQPLAHAALPPSTPPSPAGRKAWAARASPPPSPRPRPCHPMDNLRDGRGSLGQPLFAGSDPA